MVLTLSGITTDLKDKFSLADGSKGVVVVDVAKDSPAATKRVRPGDLITPGTAENTRKMVSESVEVNKSQPVPAWLEISPDTLTSKIVGIPRREDVPHPIQEQLIIELCSK